MTYISIRRAASLMLISGAVALSGCVSPGGHGGHAPHGGGYRAANTACQDCGRITEIVPIYSDGRASGAGAVAGAVVGGLLGNQVGKGDGRRAATAVGAIAGGVAGHRVEGNVRSAPVYDVHVQLDNGRYLVTQQRQIGNLRVGSYVRVSGNRVLAR